MSNGTASTIIRPDDSLRHDTSPPPNATTLFPIVTDPVPEKTFEIGLVLGGTVSVGAYTAGALDFLIQALDAWYAQGEAPHDVILKVAAGSSGGAVCAALFGILANRTFTHVTAPEDAVSDPSYRIDNKLWNTWVDTFSFDKMVDDSDLNAKINDGPDAKSRYSQHVPSLFNCKMIDEAVTDIVTYASHPANKNRPWIEKPFRVAVTVTNLRGIPYTIQNVQPVAPGAEAVFVQHDDYAWFAVPTWPANPPDDVAKKRRPDEFWVADNTVGYGVLGQWAAASGAMPIGLKARFLHRPVDHYRYRPRARPFVTPTGAIGIQVDWPVPDWLQAPNVQAGHDYSFTAVDGGTLNNDPVSLVHTALAGLVGLNPRKPENATRAILMIDPLVDEPSHLDQVGQSLVAVAKSMVGTFVGGARYLTADMDLFADQNVYSRFQLVPSRTIDNVDLEKSEFRVGADALAGSGFFAMAGWCERKFRVHDFLLGRANMREYLLKKFILRRDNPLFDGWSLALRQRFAVNQNGTQFTVAQPGNDHLYYLPIIPVFDEDAAVEPQWPVGALDPESLKAPLKGRIEAILEPLQQDNLSGFLGPLTPLVSFFAIPDAAGDISGKLVDSFRSELVGVGLWAEPPNA